jgi:hypothetical protein
VLYYAVSALQHCLRLEEHQRPLSMMKQQLLRGVEWRSKVEVYSAIVLSEIEVKMAVKVELKPLHCY